VQCVRAIIADGRADRMGRLVGIAESDLAAPRMHDLDGNEERTAHM
jgi:hypothetical protein